MSWNFSTARRQTSHAFTHEVAHSAQPSARSARRRVPRDAVPRAACGGARREVAIDVVPTVSGTTVTFNVHLTFEEDGHNVAGQTVDVKAVGPTGTKTAQLPRRMPRPHVRGDRSRRRKLVGDLHHRGHGHGRASGRWRWRHRREFDHRGAGRRDDLDGTGADDTTTDDTTTSTIVVPVATSGKALVARPMTTTRRPWCRS
jgi:hypothetical protein